MEMKRRKFLLSPLVAAAVGGFPATSLGAMVPPSGSRMRIGLVGFEYQGYQACDALFQSAPHWLDGSRFSFTVPIVCGDFTYRSKDDELAHSLGTPSRTRMREWMCLDWAETDLQELDALLVLVSLREKDRFLHWVKAIALTILLEKAARNVPRLAKVILEPWHVTRGELIQTDTPELTRLYARLREAQGDTVLIPDNGARGSRVFLARAQQRGRTETAGISEAREEIQLAQLDSLTAPVVRLFARPEMVGFRPSQLACRVDSVA
jgi:hypothetical protein